MYANRRLEITELYTLVRHDLELLKLQLIRDNDTQGLNQLQKQNVQENFALVHNYIINKANIDNCNALSAQQADYLCQQDSQNDMSGISDFFEETAAPGNPPPSYYQGLHSYPKGNLDKHKGDETYDSSSNDTTDTATYEPLPSPTSLYRSYKLDYENSKNPNAKLKALNKILKLHTEKHLTLEPENLHKIKCAIQKQQERIIKEEEPSEKLLMLQACIKYVEKKKKKEEDQASSKDKGYTFKKPTYGGKKK